MAYPFPQIKREVFPKTFLKDVHVYFEYKKIKKINNEEICTFCRENFNVDVEKDAIWDGFSINSKNNLVKFEFTTTYVAVKMNFLAYMNFISAQKYISILLDFLNVIGVKKLSKVRFAKYNELRYKLPNDESSVSIAMQQIFTKSLMEYKTGDGDFESTSFDSLARWEKRLVFDGEAELETRVIIDYGFCEQTDSKKEGVLTLKIVAESLKDIVNVCDVETVLKNCNYDIDCAFQWSISKTVIAKMRNK